MDSKKLSEERAAALEDADALKKKMIREMEAMQTHADELMATNGKLEKARKRLQNEVEDLQLNLDKEKSTVANLEKKQRKFDQVKPIEANSFYYNAFCSASLCQTMLGAFLCT